MATIGGPPPPRGPPSAPGGPQQAQAPPAYFVDTKKGEVSELKQLLKTIAVEREPKRKRDVIKKVIAYMTLGIDVSRLFTEMVLAIETRDLVVKKMVYLYLCNYAHAKPDLAIMCVNTLQRDCSSDDPMVRGLALRSLCSLRLPSMVEYISEPLRRSLTDSSPYVRKTGVMGILKLFHLAPELVQGSNMVDLLYNMIQDPDVHVITNCVIVLNELLAEEGGMAVNQPLILHLLSRVGEFTEWGLTHVLALVAKYVPADEEELFSIMNLLDPVLRTSNSGVVLATIKCFLHLTTAIPELQPQVYLRVKAPLLTLMAGGNPEVEYCILKHLEAIVHKAPGVFDDEFRQLYVRYNEPSFVKYEKVGLLALVANAATYPDIVAELAEYASDLDPEVSRRAVQALGRLAVRLPAAAPPIMERLLAFIRGEDGAGAAGSLVGGDGDGPLRAEAVLVMKDLLRKYPERRADVLPVLTPRCLRRVEEAGARAALIWMCGEYGAQLPAAPYLLEPLIDGYAALGSPLVRLTLLTAAMKLFFLRPPEVQGMLGRLLAAATNDVGNQDVHDRALLYYRLLTTDVAVAKRVVLGDGGGDDGGSSSSSSSSSGSSRLAVAGAFAEERDIAQTRAALFGEFNSLAVVYGQPSAQFVPPHYQVKGAAGGAAAGGGPLAPFSPTGGAGAGGAGAGGNGNDLLDNNADDSLLPMGGDEFEADSPPRAAGGEAAAVAAAPAAYAGPTGVDLLDMGDLGASLQAPPPPPPPQQQQQAPAEPALELAEGFALDPETFQSLWATYPEAGTYNVQCARLPPGGLAELEAALGQRRIGTLASGDLPELWKLFLFAQEAGGGGGGGGGQVFLLQALLHKAEMRLEVVLKTQGAVRIGAAGADPVDAFMDHVSRALDALGMV